MREMKIEYMEPGKLKPYAKNAKKHPAEQIEHIANSIREFGFRQPIVVDADNVVVIGHGRLLAAQKLGLEAVPVVRADDLSEEQIKALRLADNKTNESEWESAFLVDELDALDGEIDMSIFGFVFDDAEADRKTRAASEGNQALKLPPSKLYFVSVSAFGTEAETILQMKVEKETAERILRAKGKATGLLQHIKDAIEEYERCCKTGI